MITLEDFKKVELAVGEIKTAERVPETDKLLKLAVDFGEGELRQIISGIALHFPEPTTLVGHKCLFVTNLEPRTIKGLVSNGMIVAVSGDNGGFSLLEAGREIPAGTKAK